MNKQTLLENISSCKKRIESLTLEIEKDRKRLKDLNDKLLLLPEVEDINFGDVFRFGFGNPDVIVVIPYGYCNDKEKQLYWFTGLDGQFFNPWSSFIHSQGMIKKQLIDYLNNLPNIKFWKNVSTELNKLIE